MQVVEAKWLVECRREPECKIRVCHRSWPPHHRKNL